MRSAGKRRVTPLKNIDLQSTLAALAKWPRWFCMKLLMLELLVNPNPAECVDNGMPSSMALAQKGS